MTADQWAAFMFLVALWATFALGILVGRQQMRNKVNEALDEAQRIFDARRPRP